MSKKHDSYESIRDERRYGPYWYSALWRIIRPILIGLGAVLVVAGILFSVWNKVYGEFIAPPDENSTAQVPFTIESGQSLTRVANRLEEAGLIRNRTVFKYYCDFAGWGQKIQSGSCASNGSPDRCHTDSPHKEDSANDCHFFHPFFHFPILLRPG